MANVKPFAANKSAIAVGGLSVIAIFAGAMGGRITNPADAVDQGPANVETLFYDMTGPAGTVESATTFPIQPGESIFIPVGLTSNIYVNAISSGHKFSAFIIQTAPNIPPAPVPGNFPPSAPSSLQSIIPSYLYRQYADDDALQAFVASYNAIQQEYVDWFNQVSLPIYTGSQIVGTLLDWVAAGLYGMMRPTLSSGQNDDLGPYNTTTYNELAYNEARRVGSSDVTVTSDDIFKRIMTWRLYRGDGKLFNIRWMKRRIARFLQYPNGGTGNIDNTYNISVTFGAGNQIRITLPAIADSKILKECIDSGAVELPFQFSYVVTIST